MDRSVVWNAIRFFLRDLIEVVFSVYALGLLPAGSHFLFSLEKPRDTREWVIPELYLFVMVTCGTALIEAFRDRDSDGPLRSLVFAVGLIGMLGGAAAYGLLYVDPPSTLAGEINGWFRNNVLSVMIGVAVGYLAYRVADLLEDAIAEAREKSE